MFKYIKYLVFIILINFFMISVSALCSYGDTSNDYLIQINDGKAKIYNLPNESENDEYSAGVIGWDNLKCVNSNNDKCACSIDLYLYDSTQGFTSDGFKNKYTYRIYPEGFTGKKERKYVSNLSLKGNVTAIDQDNSFHGGVSNNQSNGSNNSTNSTSSGVYDFGEVHFCLQTASIWQFLGFFVILLKTLVPIAIIIFGIVDYSKASVSSDEKAVKIATWGLIKRGISGLVIFFIPTLALFMFSIIKPMNKYVEKMDACQVCLLDALGDECTDYKSYYKGIKG